MDRYLDTTREGPMYLAQESIAGIVVAALRRGDQLNQYELEPMSSCPTMSTRCCCRKSRHPD
jgi:hypothetical protein